MISPPPAKLVAVLFLQPLLAITAHALIRRIYKVESNEMSYWVTVVLIALLVLGSLIGQWQHHD